MKRKIILLAVLAVGTCSTGTLRAQGTVDDYRRADGLRQRFEGLAVDVVDRPAWIEQTHHLWYRKSIEGGYTFVWVDAETLEKRPAFDHERLASTLSGVAGKPITALKLPFSRLSFQKNEQELVVSFDGSRYTCTLADYHCTSAAEPVQRPWWERNRPGDEASKPIPSPDGQREILVRNYNVFVRTVGKEDLTPLSLDGSEGNFYEPYSIRWSPDSRRVAAYRVIPGYRREVHYIESSPTDQLQPKHSTIDYNKPGDVLDVQQPVLFDVEAVRQIVIDNTLFPNAFEMSELEWRKDSRAFTFEYNQRGHQVYRVIEVDASSGMPRALVSEEPKTFFYYVRSDGQGKKFRFDVEDGKEIVWMSERDGWNHLYLYDGKTGRVKNQITKGEWVVRDVDSVDVAKRQIWFQASGTYPDQDPYFVHYYRINFDGSGLTPLTEADGNHFVTYSPDQEFYIDVWSRVDQAPVAQLMRTKDRSVLLELERGDLTRLLAAGWSPPEVFKATGRDGNTDIWGVITRPTNFDPNRKYPVIENIYAGPQYSFVPKNFSQNLGMQALAELGFIVVQIDGMGTSNRSKAFHDVAWKNLADAGFPDRILWHKAVAARYAYYDTSRVGLYGTSAGGQSAMGGLLFHPEFYDVGVSSCGCHDNRMDKIWWNELWMSWPIGPHYAACSNVDNAYRLQGRLLLMVGEMDDNVDPSSTYQVANALIKANKNFDLVVLPGARHTSGGDYGEHKRRDFFVRHLLNVDPPAWNTPAEEKK